TSRAASRTRGCAVPLSSAARRSARLSSSAATASAVSSRLSRPSARLTPKEQCPTACSWPERRHERMTPLAAILMFTALAIPASPRPAPLDQGYRHMYNLDFGAAHRVFAAWENTHPQHPMGADRNAAADRIA